MDLEVTDVLVTVRGQGLTARAYDRGWMGVVSFRWTEPEHTALFRTASPEEIAEAVFEATNAPHGVSGMAHLIRVKWNEMRDQGLRSLSVGDTVRVLDANPAYSGWTDLVDNGLPMWVARGQVRCEPAGWARVVTW